MSNKILLIALILFFILGGFLFLKNNNKNEENKTSNNISSTQKDQETSSLKDQEVVITLDKSGFNPKTLVVKPNTRVLWINRSGSLASVNSDPHPKHTTYSPLNLGQFQNDSSVQLVFNKEGTYNYHDHLNPSKKGVVIVK